MSEDAFRASRLTVLLRMMEEPRPLLIYFSALGIHPNFDLYVGESWQQRYSVIFHFTLLTALVTVSRCNATVVLYYTADRTRQTLFLLLFFNFSFAMLALQQNNQKQKKQYRQWRVRRVEGVNKGLFKAGSRFGIRNLHLINLHTSQWQQFCVHTAGPKPTLELHHFLYVFQLHFALLDSVCYYYYKKKEFNWCNDKIKCRWRIWAPQELDTSQKPLEWKQTSSSLGSTERQKKPIQIYTDQQLTGASLPNGREVVSE